MNFRILYAINEAWHFKAQLKRYIVNPNLQLTNVLYITPPYLQAANINALVLDYDGVLAAHGEPVPRPEIIAWLQQFSRAYAPHQIYILSNKPTQLRIDFFQKHLPEIKFVIAKRKKPYPDGLQQIIEMSGLKPEQIMLVDDRLCTGILATMLAGVQGRWITKPYINIMARPFTEFGFIILRWLERVALTSSPT